MKPLVCKYVESLGQPVVVSDLESTMVAAALIDNHKKKQLHGNTSKKSIMMCANQQLLDMYDTDPTWDFKLIDIESGLKFVPTGDAGSSPPPSPPPQQSAPSTMVSQQPTAKVVENQPPSISAFASRTQLDQAVAAYLSRGDDTTNTYGPTSKAFLPIPSLPNIPALTFGKSHGFSYI